MLDVFVTSRVRRKIIVVFAKYPDFKTHVRGLSKLIQTNKQFPILKELQSIVIKSQQLEDAKKTPSKIIG